MERPLEIAKDIYQVGAVDASLRVFDIIMETQFGTTYNSYIVRGSTHTALIDTVKDGFFDEFYQSVSTVVDFASIDYIVIQHTEPDHSGSLKRVLNLAKNAKIVCSKVCAGFIKELINADAPILTVQGGDQIDLGECIITFIDAPFLHWPDTMMSYVKDAKTLFTCDVFGCHYSLSKVDTDAEHGLDFARKYYFDCIFGPFKTYVLQALERVAPLEIDVICPSHGPIIRRDVQKMMTDYRAWAEGSLVKNHPLGIEAPKVFVGYLSSYGFTKTLAMEVARGAESCGAKVDFCELKGEEGARIDAADAVAIGCPTFNRDALPPAYAALAHVSVYGAQGKPAAAFGSFGWSGEATKNLDARLKQLGFKTMDPLKVRLMPTEADKAAAFELGARLIRD